MLSNTRLVLQELESAVDALREREWRPSDAVLADTLFTLGDALVELDRLILELHRELIDRQGSSPDGTGSTALPAATPRPGGSDAARPRRGDHDG